ncbi:hypothetical protein ACS0TY_030690 [Phlomoides rotata]
MMARRMSCSCRDEVYVAAMPLRASKGPAKLVFSTAYSLNFWEFHHFMVILKSQAEGEAVVYDFQPRDPENIWVALAALSGRKVDGVILERKLQLLPTRKCWFVGYAKGNESEAAAAASKFNKNWETHLRIGHHDCRNYSQGLVECLTGKQLVLEHLRQAL